MAATGCGRVRIYDKKQREKDNAEGTWAHRLRFFVYNNGRHPRVTAVAFSYSFVNVRVFPLLEVTVSARRVTV